MNLVQTYIDMTTNIPGYTKSDCARDLANWFDRSYDLQKLNKWLRGTESLPRNVHNHMFRSVIDYAIEKEGGVPPADSDSLCDRLTMENFTPATAAKKHKKVKR